MKDCTNNITEKLESELSAKTVAILTGQCDLEDINKIIELIDYKNSELTLKLPIKPFSYVWIVTPCRYLDVSAVNCAPENCQGIFSEYCLQCEYRDKECKNGAYAEEKWFYLGSPYLNLVLDEFGKTVFDNEKQCIEACKSLYDSTIVDKLTEQYKNYREHVLNKEI